ncbi:hypothetical protein AVEN_201804-1 [Araneus ventricosus]|uniref:Uncharacterized protein n=1 Tax=Araneus ventricosus TaxID=182803 RepID=A0A4Y2LFA3_ARAVE|nr:hypothetical protein AVEN_201804-1 [Araneus ventricosus]
MIHWNTTSFSPPPLLRRFKNQEIWSEVQLGGTAAEWNFHKFPCHTQAVERDVKLVTEISQKSCRFQFQRWFYKNYTSFKIFNAKFFKQILFQSTKETEGK